MNMDTAIFIARRIAAQSILLSEEAAQKLASILIRTELKKLLEIIENKDAEGMKKYLTKIREKIK